MQDPEDANRLTYSKSIPPKIEYIENNSGDKGILFLNFIYLLKPKTGKKSAQFRCRQCGASITMATYQKVTDEMEGYAVKETFEATNLNI